jgi:hypothetical protein
MKLTTSRHHISTLIGTGALFLAMTAFAQPTIVIPPVSQAVPEGGTAVLSVSVAGTLPITYEWRRNLEWTPYYLETLDSTNCTLLLTNMTPDKSCFFSLQVSNAEGYATGKQVIVAVIGAGIETNGFALTIFGLTNSIWRVDYATNLASPQWQTLTNLSIPRTPSWFKFVDLQATNLNRFYQVHPTVY